MQTYIVTIASVPRNFDPASTKWNIPLTGCFEVSAPRMTLAVSGAKRAFMRLAHTQTTKRARPLSGAVQSPGVFLHQVTRLSEPNS